MPTKIRVEIKNDELKKIVQDYIFDRFDKGQIKPEEIKVEVAISAIGNIGIWQVGEVRIVWEGEI